MINREDHIAPLSFWGRFGCLGAFLAMLMFWAAVMYGCYALGRRQGCRNDAEIVAALRERHQPSAEIQP